MDIELGWFDRYKAIELEKLDKFIPTTQCHNNDQFFWNAIKVQWRYNWKAVWKN